MSDHLPSGPAPRNGDHVDVLREASLQPYVGGAPEDTGGIAWDRYLAAILRFKWLMLLIVLLGAGAAALVIRSGKPEYAAEGSLWVKMNAGGDRSTGPIEAGGLLRQTAWLDLIRSSQVLDTVALREGLVVTTQSKSPLAASLLQELRVNPEYVPGDYELAVAADGRQWTLRRRGGTVVDRGFPGAPIGAELGFQWRPAELPHGFTLPFSILTPAEAGRRLNERLRLGRDLEVNFIRVGLTGEDPNELARVVNAILERFVEVADRLKREDLDMRVRAVSEQLAQVQDSMMRAYRTLEDFRVSTITLPSERATPIIPGLPIARDNPVVANFHSMRQELDALRRDRDRLTNVLEEIPTRGLRVSALDIIPAVSRSSQLTRALEDLVEAEAELREFERTDLLPDHPRRRQAQSHYERLEREVVPAMIRAVVAELDQEIAQQTRVVEGTARDLTGIPVRSIEEDRLAREAAAWADLHADLQQRFQEARLAAASMVRDVELHDRAYPPQFPMQDQRFRLAVVILGGSLGLAVAAAVLLDRLDPRVRYPTQVTHEIGMEILGTVPRILKSRGRKARQNRDQVLEAFRDLRLNVEYAYGSAGPILVTISSPGQEEGKSLVSTNLALAFAEMGKKTILVDGDTRRGDAHRLLGVSRKPGLSDVLQRTVEARDAIQVTEYPHLDFLGSGSRLANSPELLATVGAQRLFAWLRGRYQVIIVDSPPMGAGSDAFVLAALTGSLALVVRNGTSDKGLIQARLASIQRLPIRILGAIMNDVEAGGAYRYYGNYIPGYAAGAEEEEDSPRSVLQGGGRAAD